MPPASSFDRWGACRATPPGRFHSERFNPATLAGPPILVRLNFGGQTRTVQPGRPNAASLRLPIPGAIPARLNFGGQIRGMLNGSTRPPIPGSHLGCPSRGPNPNGSTRTTQPGHPSWVPKPGAKPERFNPATYTRPLLPGGPCGTVQPVHPSGPLNLGRFHPDDPTRGPSLNGSTRPPMPGHPTGHPFRAPKPKRFNPGHPTRPPISAAHRRPNASAGLKTPPLRRAATYIV